MGRVHPSDGLHSLSLRSASGSPHPRGAAEEAPQQASLQDGRHGRGGQACPLAGLQVVSPSLSIFLRTFCSLDLLCNCSAPLFPNAEWMIQYSLQTDSNRSPRVRSVSLNR